MRKIRVAIVPQPSANQPSPRRRDTVLEAVRREWRGLTRSSYAGYSEA